jgi:hypothetical protein
MTFEQLERLFLLAGVGEQHGLAGALPGSGAATSEADPEDQKP